MREVELYNLYHTISILCLIAGIVCICVAVVLLIRGLGGVKELRSRMKPKPSLKQDEETEKAQEHIQKVAEALQEGRVAAMPDLGLAVTEALDETQEDENKTTVLAKKGPEVKFKVKRKMLITHVNGESHAERDNETPE